MIRTFGRCGSLDRMNTLPRASVKTDWHLGTVSFELSANLNAQRFAYLGNMHCFGFFWRRRVGPAEIMGNGKARHGHTTIDL
jgi:hypothetical protein